MYIIIGIGIGTFMHGFVPEGFFEQYMSKNNWFAVPLSVIFAVPMYANAAVIVPVIEVFVAKGIPMGTAIAFMMAVVGLSLTEATLLRAIYIAHYNNINAISFNAQDVNLYTGFKTNIREQLARVKVFVDIIFGVQPHFLGEKILID